MRLKVALLLCLIPGSLFGQVWEKLFAPGITYRMEVDEAVPRIVYAVRFSLNSGEVKAVADIGRPTILADNETKGRATVTEATAFAQAIGGINADFFPFTGDPLGLMIRKGELLSLPNPKRSVFAWGQGLAKFGRATCTATLSLEGGDALPIDGLNERCGTGQLVVDAPIAGLATAAANSTMAVVRVTGGNWTPQGTIEGEVVEVLDHQRSVPIQPQNLILVASGAKIALLAGLKPGQKLSLRFDVQGFDWSKLDNAVGGGPDLIRYTQLAVDGDEQGFSAKDFVNKRHPRTAVGQTAEGDLWFVVVDGRQKPSDGATLGELAAIMQRLGCVNAINLDGGGSSCLTLFGLPMNRPSDGKERPVADMVLFIGRLPAVEPMNLTLALPDKLAQGDSMPIRVQNERGETVPNTEILWSAIGAGWIDQGGTLHSLSPGPVTVRALVKGHYLQATMAIAPKPTNAIPPSRHKGSKR